MAVSDIQTGTGRGMVFVGGSGAIELPLVSYSYTRTVNTTSSATNSRDGIVRKATLEDISGSASGPYDTTVEPGVDITTGEIGTVRLWTDDAGSRYLAFMGIIDPFNVDSGGQTDVMNVGMSFALAYGTIDDALLA